MIVTALLLLIYGDGSGTKHTQSASAAEILAVPVSCSILLCTFQILRGAFIYNNRNLKKKNKKKKNRRVCGAHTRTLETVYACHVSMGPL